MKNHPFKYLLKKSPRDFFNNPMSGEVPPLLNLLAKGFAKPFADAAM